MVGSPADDAYGDIDARIEEARQRADRTAVWAAQVQQITGRGSALRGGVTVEVEQGGTVLALGISDAAAGSGGHADLANVILNVIKDRPLLSAGAAVAVGVYALRNPALISAVVRGFMDGRKP